MTTSVVRTRVLAVGAVAASAALVAGLAIGSASLAAESKEQQSKATLAATPEGTSPARPPAGLTVSEFLEALHECYENRGLEVVRHDDGTYQVAAGPGGPAAFEALRDSCTKGLGVMRGGARPAS